MARTKKQRAASARKAARTRAKNAGKKASQKSSKRKKTSRGMRVGALPFKARLYGKGLTPELKKMGFSATRVPVVSLVGAKGYASLSTTGSPASRKKKHKAKIDKLVRMETRLGKARADLKKAAATGNQDRVAAAVLKLKGLEDAYIAHYTFEAGVAEAIAGASPKAIRAKMKAAAKATAASIGASPKQATEAERVAEAMQASMRHGPHAAARSSSGYTAAELQAEEDRVERAMAANPDAYFYHGKKKHLFDFQPVAKGTKGAISVVVGPMAVKYATLTPKLKSNGHYSARKNMSKKKRSMRRNPLGADLAQLGKPVLGAGAGFVASRLLNAVALWGASKANVEFLGKPAGQALLRLGATGVGVVATIMWGDKVGVIRNNKAPILTGMVINALESTTRAYLAPMAVRDGWNPYAASIALGGHMGLYDVSHAGAPYSPMMGEYVAQSLNGMGEYVAQSLNGGMGTYAAEAAAGMGEYVAQSLNGDTGVDPSDQEGVDDMINSAEAYAGLGTQVMAATAGLGTQVMAATAGLGTQVMSAAAGLYGFGDAPVTRGHIGRSGNLYNFFTQPSDPYGRRLTPVSTAQAPMPVVPVGGPMPSAVPINENIATPEGRGYAGGIFGRHVFGTMV